MYLHAVKTYFKHRRLPTPTKDEKKLETLEEIPFKS